MRRLMLRGLLAALAFLASRLCPAADLKDADVQRIRAAVPDRAPVKPKRPREVLLYSHCNGFTHGGAIAAAKVAFPEMGRKTGAFEVVVSDDLANFEADRLRAFDAVILSNTTGELFMPRRPRRGKKASPSPADAIARGERLRRNFMEWVKSGRGVMGIHAATDCSYTWREYGEMMGGYFTGHPWHMLVHIKNDDPDHPINAPFGGKGFQITDEIYQFNRGVYSRRRQRVLLSLDVGEGKTPNRGKRADADYAISWLKTHGKGRIFYCSLGHRTEVFMNRRVLAHYLAGLQYALGDLEADATPRPLPK